MSRIDEELTTDDNLWRTWRESGVTENTVLAVNVFFYASVREAAEQVANALRGWGLRDVKVENTRILWLLKGWNITGVEDGTWSLAKLKERSRRYVELAERFSARYEGSSALSLDTAG